MQFEEFEDLQRYLGFGASQVAVLRRFLPIAQPHFETLVDDFYREIEKHPRAANALKGGRAQVERLKQTMHQWLISLLTDERDSAFLEQHARIGRVHVRIDLPQEFMFGAVNRIRNGLIHLANEFYPSDYDLPQNAVNQALDLELAIMLESYRYQMLERVRNAERLSSIGQLSASIGHELRGPLGVIESSNFLIEKHLSKAGTLDPTVSKHVGRIRAQVETSNRTITTLLEMTRDVQPRRANLLLSSALEKVCSRLGLANLPGPRLVLSFPEQFSVFADHDQFEQLLSNLISNALVFTPVSGSIELRGRSTRGGSELEIQDEGPGVPSENRGRIFDVLFTTRTDGTGLGLALCRKIVERHGGELELMPQRPDVGACFRVWLPDSPDA